MLDELVAVNGWSRANSRRQIGKAGRRLARRNLAGADVGYDTLKVLKHVCAKLGMPSGKYLAAVMADSLEQLDHRECHVRQQLWTGLETPKAVMASAFRRKRTGQHRP